MKALVLAPFDPEALARLSRMVSVTYEPWTESRKLYDPRELGERVREEEIAILIIEADFLLEEFFEQARPLKMVGVCRGALNHVDLEAAVRFGVRVVHTPGRTAQAVAELALGLMLSLARRIPWGDRYLRSGSWQDPVEPYLTLRGTELAGKTLGLVGLGAVGRRVARLARAFDMRVLAHDPYVKARGPRKAGAFLVDLATLLREADFVSLHVPLTPETQGLLDASRLSQMKAGAYLINTAAAEVVDAEALARKLKEGHLAGAALDVFESHPPSPSHPLLQLDNVVLTPHIGGATQGTVARHSWMMVEEVQRFLQGKRPRRPASPR